MMHVQSRIGGKRSQRLSVKKGRAVNATLISAALFAGVVAGGNGVAAANLNMEGETGVTAEITYSRTGGSQAAADAIPDTKTKGQEEGAIYRVQAQAQKLSRADFLKRLVNLLGLEKEDKPGAAYSDTRNLFIEEAGYIDAALNAGLISAADAFHPYQPITRQQAASMLVRAVETRFNLSAANHIAPYLDARAGNPLSHELTWNAWLGLVTGSSGSQFRGTEPLQAAEAERALNQLEQLLAREQLPPPPILPLSEVKPGIRGVAQTVIEGQKVEQFTVEVMDILRGQGLGGTDIILVRGSGPLLTRSHGIASGMSGSPVYFNGKIAGAIAIAFPDETMAGVTPIEAMLAGAPLTPADGNMQLEKPVRIQGQWVKELEIRSTPPVYEEAGSSANHAGPSSVGLSDGSPSPAEPSTAERALTFQPQPGKLVARPLPMPLMVSGLHGASLTSFEEAMKKKGISVVSGSGTRDSQSSHPLGRALQPGDMMGVALAQGDLVAYGMGTVTYVDHEQLWGFGHPMNWSGESHLPLTEVWVSAVMKGAPGLIPPYKMGSIGPTIGTLIQDRASAVSGRVGEVPPTIPMRMTTRDSDRDRSASLNVNLAQDKTLFPALAPSAAVEGVLRSMDRLGSGTMQYTLTLETEELGSIIREDMRYDPYDASFIGYQPVSEILNLLTTNPFQEVSIKNIRFEGRVTEANKTAELIEARLVSPAQVAAGNTVDVAIKLRPWRAEEKTISVPVQVPKTLPPGPAQMIISPGSPGGTGFMPFPGEMVSITIGSSAPLGLDGNPREPESLQELVDQFVKAPKGNEIVFSFLPMDESLPQVPGMMTSADGAAGTVESPVPAEPDIPVPDSPSGYFSGALPPMPPESKSPEPVTYATDWVIQGTIEAPLTLEVLPPSDTSSDDAPSDGTLRGNTPPDDAP